MINDYIKVDSTKDGLWLLKIWFTASTHCETVCLLSQHSSDKHIDAELGLDELT